MTTSTFREGDLLRPVPPDAERTSELGRYLDWLPKLLTSNKSIMFLCLGILLIGCRIVYPDLRAAWKWSRRGSIVAIAGCCIVVLGGCVLESIGYRFLQPGSLGYKMEVSIEEFLEMLGATLILHSVTTFALDSLDHYARGTDLASYQTVPVISDLVRKTS